MGKPDQPRNKDGTWRSRGGVGLVGVGLAAALAFGSSGAAGVADVGTALGRPSAPKSHAKARQKDPARTILRLERRGLKVRERSRSIDGDCAAHSYGQVRTWFRDHPCDALFRTLFEITDGHGGDALVAVAWVDMPTDAQSAELKTLVDRNGTGNVSELSRTVTWTGRHYASTNDGATVVDAQAEPAGGTASAIALAGAVRDAVG